MKGWQEDGGDEWDMKGGTVGGASSISTPT